jgi:hypothetical protein
MTTDDNGKSSKKFQHFYCDKCDYLTSRYSQYSRHVMTAKHAKTTLLTTNDNGKFQKVPTMCSKQHSCSHCNKKFNDRAGLWRHNKKCAMTPDKDVDETLSTLKKAQDNDIILLLIKENAELKHMMMEQHASTQNAMMEVIKNGTHNTNSNNKTFNLQFFLNETCKDAMNIMDFVDSLKIQLSDLENVGKLGFVDGIANIIVKNLQALDVTKRPVHCSDSKREVMYIKDEDKWEKENDEKKKMRKVIKHIAHKNSKMLPEFKAKYPDCIHSNSTKSDQYNKIIIESMGGFGDNHDDTENKIIKKIAKEVVIDK